ncbi:MAG: PQQ-binding-like beta-propeller repeat protein [Planctomycetia bacterium]|nr:PQQ-binding-like beta-propeller repeat protein [Planctomycetia bacterium]
MTCSPLEPLRLLDRFARRVTALANLVVAGGGLRTSTTRTRVVDFSWRRTTRLRVVLILKQLLLIVLLSTIADAQDSRAKVESEPFPQSAKIARDRQVDAIFEASRAQIAKREFAPAIAALQGLLDTPNVFVVAGSHGLSVVAEANRLLADVLPAGRELYERLHGSQAERLWRNAREQGDVKGLRGVITRFGQTIAGWNALRDLAARHADRGEWELAVAASEELARHSHSASVKDAAWLAHWVLSLSHVEQTRHSARAMTARELLQKHRTRLEQSSAPPNVPQANLALWLEEQLRQSKQHASTNKSKGASDTQKHDNSQSIIDGPAGPPVWQIDAGLIGESAKLMRDLLDGWRGYDVLALPSAKPLIVGDVIVSRFAVPAKVIAVDVRQGRKLWENVATDSIVGITTDLQRHPGIQGAMFDELQRRWFGDSVRGRMTTDGRRLFLIQDAEAFDFKPGSGTILRNHLDALDLATGQRLWRVGGSNSEPSTELQGTYFIGPPLVSDGVLYLVAQRESLISLLALRADDGRLEWSVQLAESDRQQFKEQSWRHVACPVTWSAGQLVCPTSAGCVVAVDPLTRTLAWSFRFERDDISSATGFTSAERDRPFPALWWESWREMVLSDSRSGTLIVASPESRSLRGLDARSGKLRWRTEFNEPVFAVMPRNSDDVTADQSGVLVFERHKVSAVDSATGKIAWTKWLSSPAAQGDWKGDRYLMPLQRGGWAAIDVRDGAITRYLPEKANVSGQLVRASNRWMVLSPYSISSLESFSTRQRIVTDRVIAKPEDADARIEMAWLKQQAGDSATGEESLRTLLTDKDHSDKGQAALRQMLLRRIENEPTDHAAVERELLELSRSAAEQIEVRHALIEAARRSGSSVDALRLTLELTELHPSDDVIVVDRLPVAPVAEVARLQNQSHEEPATRTVRRDRWLQGVIANLLENANPATRPELLTMIAARRQKSEESLDTFALQQFADQLMNLSFGREVKLQLSGRTGVGLGYVRTNLALRDIAGSDDRSLAAQSWYRLALLHEFRSEPLEAADCYRELRDRYADVKLPSGRSTTEWLADVMADTAIGRSLANGPAETWPLRTPKVTEQEESHDDIYCNNIPIESRDPFWRRLTVSVERNGKKVRFQGAGQRGYWELPLPESKSPFRLVYQLHRGWGIGPLLVLQMGDDLFGIQPIDDRGETNSRILWTIPTGDPDEIGGYEIRPGRLGFTVDDLLYLDRYQQPVLSVLHVGPGLICYRQQNRLIAADPATGARLWMRHGLSPRTSITADDEFVLMKSADSHKLEVLRGFDGQLLTRRVDKTPVSSVILTQGRLQVSSSAVVPASKLQRLICEDLVTGAIRWQRNLVPVSTPFRIDESRIGLLEAPESLRILSLADGQELVKHTVTLPNTLSNVHCFGDESRLFLIISGPVTEKGWLATDQDRGGHRKVMANGWLHAFERASLKPLWTIPARNLPIALDQPQDLPILVLPYRRPSDDSTDGKHPDGVVQVLDKRTGKELLYNVGNINNNQVAIDPNTQDGHIDLLTKSRRIRLDYNAVDTP